MKLIMGMVSLLVVLVSCQQKQTKVTSQDPIQAYTATAEDLRKAKAVILDVRPAFEFNIAHAPGAININWQDFSQPDPRLRGLLLKDSYAMARRLSLIGIDPETAVIVLGKGTAGHGEEGRVAWTLRYLGVKYVYTLNSSSFREQNNNPYKQVPAIKNKPYWKPKTDESLLIGFDAFQDKVKGNVVVIDVRSRNEFSLPQTARGKWKTQRVYHIDWQDFFQKDGLIKKGVSAKLSELGIDKNEEIILISNQGVRSGAVSFALKELGFAKPMNFAGGYNLLH